MADFVGDTRRLFVSSLNCELEGPEIPMGEAWQDEKGMLHGTGALALFLAEPIITKRYISASSQLNISPLVILGKRLSRNLFLIVTYKDADNG
jgi:hypothetical protein